MSTDIKDFVNDLSVRNPLKGKGMREKLSINEKQLDEEMRGQPALAFLAGAAHSQAQKQHERLKRAAEVVRSSLAKEVRKTALDSQEKITEPAIAAEVEVHPIMRRVEDMVIDAKEVLGICKSMNEAFDQRSRMISQLAKRESERLSLESYHSAPKRDHSGRAERLEKATGINVKKQGK